MRRASRGGGGRKIVKTQKSVRRSYDNFYDLLAFFEFGKVHRCVQNSSTFTAHLMNGFLRCGKVAPLWSMPT